MVGGGRRARDSDDDKLGRRSNNFSAVNTVNNKQVTTVMYQWAASHLHNCHKYLQTSVYILLSQLTEKRVLMLSFSEAKSSGAKVKVSL